MNNLVDDIKKVGDEANRLINEEEATLMKAVKASNKLLRKKYGVHVMTDSGRYLTSMVTADVWLKMDKYFLALAVKDKILTARYLRYYKNGKDFEVQIFGTTWPDCRRFVNIDQVLQAILDEMTTINYQFSSSTPALVEKLDVEMARLRD